MLSLWGEMVIMVGTPIILVPIARGMKHLGKRHHQDEELG